MAISRYSEMHGVEIKKNFCRFYDACFASPKGTTRSDGEFDFSNAGWNFRLMLRIRSNFSSMSITKPDSLKLLKWHQGSEMVGAVFRDDAGTGSISDRCDFEFAFSCFQYRCDQCSRVRKSRSI